MPTSDNIVRAAQEISRTRDADVFLLNGEFERPLDLKLINLVERAKSNPNVLLILVTPGGSADVAYRIARTLQESYEKISIFVTGWCKSAGTLCAIGAHELIISREGELGPLDVQLGRKDDLFGYESGLDIGTALQTLQGYVTEQFENLMLRLIARSEGRISVALASEVSSTVAVGLFSQIYAQIDPIKIGEVARSMTIAKDYGRRLASLSDNLAKPDNIDLLVSSYCSHSFVIDFLEAKSLFKNVSRPDADLLKLHKLLGDLSLYPHNGDPVVTCLSQSLNSTQPNPTGLETETDDARNKDATEAEAGSRGSAADPNPERPDAESSPGEKHLGPARKLRASS